MSKKFGLGEEDPESAPLAVEEVGFEPVQHFVRCRQFVDQLTGRESAQD